MPSNPNEVEYIHLRVTRGNGHKVHDHPHFWIIYCEGCRQNHYIPKVHPSGKGWTFNGDIFNPHFSPSVKISYEGSPNPELAAYCCHFNIEGGRIVYHGDCTHHMKNTTIDLPEVYHRKEWD